MGTKMKEVKASMGEKGSENYRQGNNSRETLPQKIQFLFEQI